MVLCASPVAVFVRRRPGGRKYVRLRVPGTQRFDAGLRYVNGRKATVSTLNRLPFALNGAERSFRERSDRNGPGHKGGPGVTTLKRFFFFFLEYVLWIAGKPVFAVHWFLLLESVSSSSNFLDRIRRARFGTYGSVFIGEGVAFLGWW